ncbi:putative aldo-keto reductase 1 isoform X2 [Gossypium australe]|uniref:Putative aldo-keto reductase 1 isoform X2 n=1 Tax=Gossypium australe TaxID=47621 RepID=A0A5B6WX01_9ROSI|nr:putative aldo-keto reductase 1 isoform X2 [Gossypium australe]
MSRVPQSTFELAAKQISRGLLNCNETYGSGDCFALLLAKMGELKKLVEEGKMKYIGLSEASVDT